MTELKIDSTRTINNVPRPYQTSLSKEELFNKGYINWKKLIHFFSREGRLDEILVR
jgi:hypothetical protein